MANCTYADYMVEGDDKQVETLYQIMRKLEETEMNEEGNVWLGHLVCALGGDTQKIDCSAWWKELCLYEGTLHFQAESNWGEKMEARHFIEQQLPGIKIWYECTADDFWVTNDKDGCLFNRYVLYTEERGEDYYRTLEEVIAEVEDVTGLIGLKTLKDCKEALMNHYEDEEDFLLGEFEIIE